MPVKGLIVSDPGVYYRIPDGKVFTPSPGTYEHYWKNYLHGFDEVIIATRVFYVNGVDASWQQADGEGITFRSVPLYHGPGEYLRHYGGICHVLWKALSECDTLLYVTPGFLGAAAVPLARLQRKPYLVEVVGSPYDVFAPHAMQHPLRPLFRHWFTLLQRYHCRRALAASYVTRESLQQFYPPGPNTYAHFASNVYLPEEAFATQLRQYFDNRGCRLIYIGTMQQLYKAPDRLIEAVALVRQSGLNVTLTMIGDGQYRPALEALARQLQITDYVCFLGQLPPGQPLHEQLDQADIFVLPSHQEGLPRAMIEAMARGLPCIGSHAGGIPELLPPEDRVPPGNSRALAEKIIEMASDPARLIQTSARNLQKAREYHASIIQARKAEFYRTIRQMVLDHVRD